jgi:uncharacterized protein
MNRRDGNAGGRGERQRSVAVWVVVAACLLLACFAPAAKAQRPKFKALAIYTTKGEKDHLLFANDALEFYRKLAREKHFTFEATTDWERIKAKDIGQYQVVLWLNDFPHTAEQRAAFEKYMEHGGGWLGFHVAAYNDESTGWPWFVDLLGGAVFYTNNWPPLPAKLIVDEAAHPVTKGVPATFTAPANEWYIWKPSPRLNKDVKVLATLDPANYPLGIKNVITSGDLPVVWTNTKYRMLYMNMGHGDKIFTDATQNRMIANGLLWLGEKH